jgi:diadenosine tetraphosphate (Ap4A) HIT family hydrolase
VSLVAASARQPVGEDRLRNVGGSSYPSPSFSGYPSCVNCPLCERLAKGASVESNALAAAIPDGFPVSQGHTLVVPRRHEADVFRLNADETRAVLELVGQVRDRLARELKPDGFNIGINVGAAAGQTVAHAHVHVIPRKKGDVEDPRGGVRWVVPGKAKYW